MAQRGFSLKYTCCIISPNEIWFTLLNQSAETCLFWLWRSHMFSRLLNHLDHRSITSYSGLTENPANLFFIVSKFIHLGMTRMGPVCPQCRAAALPSISGSEREAVAPACVGSGQPRTPGQVWHDTAWAISLNEPRERGRQGRKCVGFDRPVGAAQQSDDAQT